MERVLRSTPNTLQHTFYVDGTATNPSPDSATVAITKADGSTLVASTSATEGGTGIFTYTLAPQSTLDHLDVTWTATIGGQTVIETDRVEIVGGFYCTISELQAVPGLSAISDNDVVQARTEFEDLAERYTGQAWVPRFHRERLVGPGRTSLLLSKFPVRSILAASSTNTSGTVTAFTTTNWYANTYGLLVTDGDDLTASVYGEANLTVAYEHGADHPPEPLRRACRMYVGRVLLADRAQVGRDTLSSSTPDGYNVRYSTPDWDAGRPTGILEVDSILNSLGRAAPALA
jgi:hypothetical protein